MKRILKKCETLNIRIEKEDFIIVKKLQEKYSVNISSLLRNCLRNKYKELESK